MAHRTLKEHSYNNLTARLNCFPQGAPPSELLQAILSILFSAEEADLVSLLPIKPFTAAKAARIWKMEAAAARKILEKLAGRALLVDVERNGESVYTLPPPMAGFFEFSMMRLRADIDQKALSELFYQYLNREDDFIRELFTRGETQIGRAFVHEPVLADENALQVLDYERATEVIKTATCIGVGLCYCRHKMQHLGRACDAPLEICMTFNNAAESLTKHGHARVVDVAEGLDVLQRAYDHNLVQFGENVREKVSFICNCCGCCCEAMLAAKRFAVLQPIHTTNFLPVVDAERCSGCGKCVETCPVEAMSLVSANDPGDGKRKIARLNADICLGCGLCARVCAAKRITLESRPQRLITPLNGAHRAVVMAIERGTLQHLVFDNRVLWSHRALAALLGVVLRLPPLKQLMASRQIKSRYLEALIRKSRV